MLIDNVERFTKFAFVKVNSLDKMVDNTTNDDFKNVLIKLVLLIIHKCNKNVVNFS